MFGMNPRITRVLVDAGIPLLGGIYATLIGFGVVGTGKSGTMKEGTTTMLRFVGPFLILYAIF